MYSKNMQQTALFLIRQEKKALENKRRRFCSQILIPISETTFLAHKIAFPEKKERILSTNFNPHLRSGLFSGQNFFPEKKESNFVHKTTRKNFLSFRDVKKFTEKGFLLVSTSLNERL